MKNILAHHLLKACVSDDVINGVKDQAFVIIRKERIFTSLTSKTYVLVSLCHVSDEGLLAFPK